MTTRCSGGAVHLIQCVAVTDVPCCFHVVLVAVAAVVVFIVVS